MTWTWSQSNREIVLDKKEEEEGEEEVVFLQAEIYHERKAGTRDLERKN